MSERGELRRNPLAGVIPSRMSGEGRSALRRILRGPARSVRARLRSFASLLIRVGRAPSIPPVPDGYLSPDELRRTLNEGDLLRTAEAYFSNIQDPTDLLTKPYSRVEDTPHLLINFAVLLQGMDLAPGMVVLDFAAGTCWASHILSQLGCRVIAVDVSPSALEIGRELYRRRPIIGRDPEREFLTFDGSRLPLADGSVERIFCFDAFHHVPNQDEVLREMHRVLAEGGIAAFGEPGPYHSRTDQSQYEMKTYHVLEDDIDIEAIWASAKEAGFSDIRLAIFNAAPMHVSLEGFQDLVRGGPTGVEYLDLTRQFLANVRDFFLYKGVRGAGDSRWASGLAAGIEVTLGSSSIPAGERASGSATVTNRGTASWLPSSVPYGGVSLGCHLSRDGGELIDLDFYWQELAKKDEGRIAAGESITVPIELPPLDEGDYVLEFDLVSNRVCWFGQRGSPTVQIPLRVTAR